jgi:hypothetical protein
MVAMPVLVELKKMGDDGLAVSVTLFTGAAAGT